MCVLCRPLSCTAFHTCVPPLSFLPFPEGFSNTNSCRLTRVSITLVVKPIGWAHFLPTPARDSRESPLQTVQPGRPRASRLCPAGRRLMTLCLPSNRLFDNKPASVPPWLRRTGTTLHRVATGREECGATHKHWWENRRASPASENH